MKKVIIVDDETMVIESIVHGVNWTSLNTKVVATFLNSEEALEYIKTNPVDILIADISVPPFNGLILCSYAAQINPQIQFIIISGFADFSYAKKSIQLGSVGYCLKPIDYDEITIFIKKAVAKVSTKTEKYQHEFIELVYEKNIEEVNAILKSNHVKSNFNMSVSIGKKSLEEYFDGFHCSVGVNKYLYIYNFDNVRQIPHNLIRDETIKGISYVDNCITSSDLGEIASQLIYDAYQFFFYKDKFIFKTKAEYNINLNQEIRNSLKNSEKLITILKTQFRKINHIQQAADIYNLIISCDIEEGCGVYSYEQLVYEFENIDELIDSLVLFIEETNIDIQDYKSNNKNFLSMVKYINQNFTNEISIKSISDQLYLNPNYISQLFKKEAGTTFVKYITNLRIEKAKELLINSRLSINEVSKECGFKDYFYFIKIFKKHCNKAPTEYRKSI